MTQIESEAAGDLSYEVHAISDVRGWVQIPISQSLCNSFRAAQEGLFETLTIEEKLNLVLENYAEFERALLEIALNDSLFQHEGYVRSMDRLHLVIRRLMNFFSTGRTYTEQVPAGLRRIFGKKSDEVERFNEALARLREDDGFRLVEELRNHAQHFGFPVHMISSGGRKTELGDNWKIRQIATARVAVKDLLKDPRFDRLVSPLLETQGGRIDVRVIVRSYMAGLGRLHELVRPMLEERVSGWEADFQTVERSATEVVIDADLDSVRVLRADNVLERIPYFPDMNERRRYLEEKNRYLANIDRRFVSSEIANPRE